MRISTKVGRSTWLSMGPIGWIAVGLFWFTLILLVLGWPYGLLVTLFPHQVWAAVVGIILTVLWNLILLGAWLGARATTKDERGKKV